MRIDFHGKVIDEAEIRVGFIGCGSHAFRNIFPTFQFAPVDLVATADLDVEKARAFAKKFSAPNAYGDYRKMLESEELDAVFVVVGYDRAGRPLYPEIAAECLAAGCHVWMEKPPAATSREVETLRAAAREADVSVMVGFKKMFMPVNRKVHELIGREDFGDVALLALQYPQRIPTVEEFRQYLDGGERVGAVVAFLDHICHPASLAVYLLGAPETLYYERGRSGAGVATLAFASGAVASIALTGGQATTGGMERTVVVGTGGAHIVADNNVRLYYHKTPPTPEGQTYGSTPDFFTGGPGEASSYWEPEFSLGQLYNKGLFLLGYYDEVNEFARSILDRAPLERGTLGQALVITRIFEAFAEGPGRVVPI